MQTCDLRERRACEPVIWPPEGRASRWAPADVAHWLTHAFVWHHMEGHDFAMRRISEKFPPLVLGYLRVAWSGAVRLFWWVRGGPASGVRRWRSRAAVCQMWICGFWSVSVWLLGISSPLCFSGWRISPSQSQYHVRLIWSLKQTRFQWADRKPVNISPELNAWMCSINWVD